MTTIRRRFPSLLTILLALSVTGASAQHWKLADDLSVRRLADGIWLHTSTLMIGQELVPANGLLVTAGDGLLLIDTPFTDEQTERLLGWANKQLKRKVVEAIVTHSHNDRLGGIGALLKHGIVARSTPMTYALVDTTKYQRPTPSLGNDTVLTVGGTRVEVFYPGAGHTRDNIVVWLPAQRVLFGGCLVKADSAESLGYIAEADLASWPGAIGRVIERYPRARLVVPGHGAVGGQRLLRHTLELLRATPGS